MEGGRERISRLKRRLFASQVAPKLPRGLTPPRWRSRAYPRIRGRAPRTGNRRDGLAPPRTPSDFACTRHRSWQAVCRRDVWPPLRYFSRRQRSGGRGKRFQRGPFGTSGCIHTIPSRFPPARIGEIMRDADQTDQARGCARCGSFEVRFLDGRPSKYFHWDEDLGRRLRPDLPTRQEGPRTGKGLRKRRAR